MPPLTLRFLSLPQVVTLHVTVNFEEILEEFLKKIFEEYLKQILKGLLHSELKLGKEFQFLKELRNEGMT